MSYDVTLQLQIQTCPNWAGLIYSLIYLLHRESAGETAKVPAKRWTPCYVTLVNMRYGYNFFSPIVTTCHGHG